MDEIGINVEVVRPLKTQYLEALHEACEKLGRLEMSNYLSYVIRVASIMREGLELDDEKSWVRDNVLVDEDYVEHSGVGEMDEYPFHRERLEAEFPGQLWHPPPRGGPRADRRVER